VATSETRATNERELARMMVGRELLPEVSRREVPPGRPILEVCDLWALDDRRAEALRGVSFSVHQGEIFGIAGVDGNGQNELAQALTGLRRVTRGEVRVNSQTLTNAPPWEVIAQGVSHIPEDRHRFGLVLNFTVAENAVLDTVGAPLFTRGPFLRERGIEEHATRLVADYDIRTPGVSIPAWALSGGNPQKLIRAREISRGPGLFVACQPTRGLDVAATEYIHRQLLSQRDEGKAILLISTELEELFALSDRIGVLYRGELMGVLPRGEARVEEVGLMMAGVKRPPQGGPWSS
jgi:simple sugar transport system ATP-binding protein